MKTISPKFHQKALTITFFAGFCSKQLKLEKGGPTYLSLNPFPWMPFFATNDRKQIHCVNIVVNNETGPLRLEFN